MLGGVIADRFPIRRVLVLTDLAQGISQGLLALLLGLGRPSLWSLMALVAVIGAGSAITQPALMRLTAHLADQGTSRRMYALKGLCTHLGVLGGPALAGLLVLWVGPGWTMGVDALSYAVSAACLLAIQAPQLSTPTLVQDTIVAQLRDGWREFASRETLWLIVGCFSVMQVFAMSPFMIDGAVLVIPHPGGAAAWGLILSAEGVGGVLGGLWAMRLAPRRPYLWVQLTTLPLALPPLMLALHLPLGMIALASAAGGAGIAVCNVLWNTAMQASVPPHALARVKAYDILGSSAMSPVGYLLATPMAGWLGPQGAMGLGAGMVVLIIFASLGRRSLWQVSA